MASHLKHFLQQVLAPRDDWKVSLLINWPNIVGTLHERMTLEKIEEDILIIGVYDSCWMQELYLLSSMLLATINQKLDQPRIKQLRFKKASIKRTQDTIKQCASVQEAKKIIISPSEEKALITIEDPGLQAVLKGYLIRCYQGRS
jgi:hypothetical protein